MRTTIITGLLTALLASAATAATPKPVKIYIIAGQSNAESRQSVDFLRENFPELAKPRDDVWLLTPAIFSPTPLMGPNYKSYGVEHAAGYMLGDAIGNDVIFIRSAVGGTMLYDRWRSPSAAKRLGGPVGDLYETMIRRVHNQLAHLHAFYPRYRGQGYELAGFIWFQGENDCCAKTQGFYRDGLMDLIKDVRAELGVAKLPFVISKINDGCWGPPAVDVWAANEYAAHADKNVVAINTRDLRGLCHYDAQSYVTIGQRIGRTLLPFAKTPVHVGDEQIRAASKAYFARIAQPSSPQDMAPLKKGLVGYWKFDEGEGMTTKSAIPGGAAGRLYSRPAGGGKWVKGKFGKAVKQTGKQAITFANYTDPVNADGQIEQMSIAFWARTTGGRGEYRIGKGTGATLDKTSSNWYWSRNANRQGWDVRGFDGGLASMTGMVKSDGKSQAFAAFAREGFGDDGVTWRHQAYVYDGLKKEIRFYTNGRLIQTARSTVTIPRKNAKTVTPSIEPTPLLAANVPLMIGGVELGDMAFDFHIFDELAIWSRPLSGADVKALYNDGAGAEIIPADPLSVKSLDELRKTVKTHVDPNVRYRAVRTVATRGEAGVALLVETLKDKSAGVRYGAAQALGEMGRSMQGRALTMLKSDDRDTQVLGTVMLKHMGRAANPAKTVPALVAVMSDEFFDVRMGAVDALGKMGNWAEAAIPALLTATSDKEWWVRESAAMALTKIQTPQTRSAMIDVMTKERHSVLWFQAAGIILKPIEEDPALRDKLARAYATWLLKGEGWTAPFAARGKFNQGVKGLARYAKDRLPIPPEVAKTIRRVLDDETAPLWRVDDKTRKTLEGILATMKTAKGAK